MIPKNFISSLNFRKVIDGGMNLSVIKRSVKMKGTFFLKGHVKSWVMDLNKFSASTLEKKVAWTPLLILQVLIGVLKTTNEKLSSLSSLFTDNFTRCCSIRTSVRNVTFMLSNVASRSPVNFELW